MMWSMVTLPQTSLGRHCCVLLIAVWNLVALILLIRSLVTGQATAGGQLLGAAARLDLLSCRQRCILMLGGSQRRRSPMSRTRSSADPGARAAKLSDLQVLYGGVR